MSNRVIHQCQCQICQEANFDPTRQLHSQMNLLLSRLDEQQRRWYVALEAKKLGHGGVKQMSIVTGMDPSTIRRGTIELEDDLSTRPVERVRMVGGGRQKVEQKKPEIEAKLLKLVKDETGGDPMSEKKWVRRTLRQLSKGLERLGDKLGRTTIGRLLKKNDYALRQNRKEKSTQSHPDRDRQFKYINRIKKLFMEQGYPVISVDPKKKELIGNFYQKGKSWEQKAKEVNTYDFPQDATGKAVPYGIYDPAHNQGYVYVGTSADTSEFAVDAIRWWWQHPDRPRFEREDKLLILCDAGGSNGSEALLQADHRRRLWKRQIQKVLADNLGLEVMVCHYPSGASKWNPIEHHLFSYISLNWAGQPLRSFGKMLNYLRGTRTETGLEVKATLTRKQYQVGLKVKDQEMKELNFERRRICPQWNYLFKPRCLSSA